MPNKLLIKANFCDLRNVKEETLAAYDVIEVRANVVVLNDRTKELIARYPVTLKCDLATDNPNIALRSVNGVAEVTPCDVPEADTVLTVNGELKIASGSAEVLARYLQITVNGQVYCPRSLSGKLGNVAVNGQIITWPDGAVQLKNTAVLDSTFALRAKPALYWAARCVVLVDPTLDIAALAERGVQFDTPKAILAQSLAAQAAPLFEDDTDLEIVPDGTAYLKDDAELTAALIRRKGNKLYVDGRLTLTAADKVYRNKGNIYATKVTVTDLNGKVLNAGTDYEKTLLYTYKEDTTLDDGTVRKAGTVIDKKDIIPAGTVICVTVTPRRALDRRIRHQNLRYFGSGGYHTGTNLHRQAHYA